MVQTEKEKEKKSNSPIKNLEELNKLYSVDKFNELLNKISGSKKELDDFALKIENQIQQREKEAKIEATARESKKQEKIEKVEVVKENNNKSEKTEEIKEKAEKPETEKVEKVEKEEKTEKVENREKEEKTEKTEKTEEKEKVEKVEKTQKPKIEKTEKLESKEKADKPKVIEKQDKKPSESKFVISEDKPKRESEKQNVQKTEQKQVKPSTPKFEFRPKNDRNERNNERNENRDRNRNYNNNNGGNGKFSRDDNKSSYVRNNDRQNRNENRDNKGQNRQNIDQRDKNFGNRNYNNNNGNNNNNNQRPRTDRNFDPNKKPMMNKRPFEPKQTPIAEKIIIKETDRQFGNKKKTHQNSQEKKQLSVRQQMRMGIIDNEVDEDRQIFRRVKTKKKEEVKQVIAEITNAVITTDNLTVKILSEAIGKPVAEIIKKMIELGYMCTINSPIDYETAELIASDFGITLEKKVAETFEEKLKSEIEKENEIDSKFMQPRPPIVTVMGHVDHGKTSLLDAIRKTNVIEKEAGGITQHIGAYSVKTSSGESITFLDTPGHEAFTAMRERGAQVTDIAILIVAADDGVMPQTKESIRIIKEAKIPMVIAINKIDKPGANIPRLLGQLAENGIELEEWGGDVISVQISAKKGENIDKLLDSVILVSEMLELKANPNAKASGVVIESKLDKGLGPVATVIITNGTLKVGDSVASGTAYGRIRALLDENGKKIKKAGPSTPVSILGLDAVPNAGDKMNVIDEKMLKQLVNERKSKKKEEKIVVKKVSKEDLFSKDTRTKVLSIIVKADVQGSAQAIKDAIMKIENEEVRIDVISADVGAVTENDLLHATTSQNTMIICFNQKVNPKAKLIADREKIEIKDYSVIYQLIDDVTEKAKGMMDPKYKEVPIGKAEVRAVFNLSSSGIIAGSYVLEGKIQRNAKCRVLRKNKVVAETDIVSLKNKQEDVKEIGVQFECGIKLKDFNEVKEGDIIDAYILERIN